MLSKRVKEILSKQIEVDRQAAIANYQAFCHLLKNSQYKNAKIEQYSQFLYMMDNVLNTSQSGIQLEYTLFGQYLEAFLFEKGEGELKRMDEMTDKIGWKDNLFKLKCELDSCIRNKYNFLFEKDKMLTHFTMGTVRALKQGKLAAHQFFHANLSLGNNLGEFKDSTERENHLTVLHEAMWSLIPELKDLSKEQKTLHPMSSLISLSTFPSLPEKKEESALLKNNTTLMINAFDILCSMANISGDEYEKLKDKLVKKAGADNAVIRELAIELLQAQRNVPDLAAITHICDSDLSGRFCYML